MPEHALPKTYNFKETEGRIYDWWQENGYFKPSNDPASPDFDPSIKPYVISIPPPNVTGELHLGLLALPALLLVTRLREAGWRPRGRCWTTPTKASRVRGTAPIASDSMSASRRHFQAAWCSPNKMWSCPRFIRVLVAPDR